MVDFIFPYVGAYAKGDELRYAIRGLFTNYRGPFRVWVIGSRPQWLVEGTKVRFISAPVLSSNYIMDVVAKMRSIIAHSEIGDDFVWMNDDIYLINPASYREIYGSGGLWAIEYLMKRPSTISDYRKRMAMTWDRLKKEGLSTWNTNTHMPFFYNKAKLAFILDKYKPERNCYLISMLYHNHWYSAHRFSIVTEEIKFAIYSYPVKSLSELEKKTCRSLWFNHSDTGYKESKDENGLIIPRFLEKKLGVPSEAEA